MRCARVDHHLRCATLPFQSVVQFLALRQWYSLITLAMLDQRRCADSSDMEHRRMSAIGFQLVPKFATEIVGEETGNVGSPGKADQVGDSGANRCSAKSLGLRDGPGSHETSVAPSH